MGINDIKKKKKGLGRAPESIPYNDDNMKETIDASVRRIIRMKICLGLL